MIEYVSKYGLTGRKKGEMVTIHSADGHIIYCRRMTEIQTREELIDFVDVISTQMA